MPEKLLAHQASFEAIATISDDIIYGLHDQRTGDAVMGLALSLARLLSPEAERDVQEDAQFVTDLVDWAYMRLTPPEGGVN